MYNTRLFQVSLHSMIFIFQIFLNCFFYFLKSKSSVFCLAINCWFRLVLSRPKRDTVVSFLQVSWLLKSLVPGEPKYGQSTLSIEDLDKPRPWRVSQLQVSWLMKSLVPGEESVSSKYRGLDQPHPWRVSQVHVSWLWNSLVSVVIR